MNAFLFEHNITNTSILPENVTLPIQQEIEVYPYGFLSFSVALLGIYFLEKTLEFIVLLTIKPNVVTAKSVSMEVNTPQEMVDTTQMKEQQPMIQPGMTTIVMNFQGEPSHDHHDGHSHGSCSHHGHDHQEKEHNTENKKESQDPKDLENPTEDVPVVSKEDLKVCVHDKKHEELSKCDNDSHIHVHMDVSGLKSSSRKLQFLSGMILWVSLMAHSVFEGLGLGAAGSDNVVNVIVAILSHHLISSFTLGTVLSDARLNFCIDLFFIVSFSLAVPLGIWIGIGISSLEDPVYHLIQSLCLAAAGGAFVYVAVFEVLAHFSPKKDGWLIFVKMFTFVIGFTLLACLVLVEGGH